MKFTDVLKQCFFNLWRRKIRTLLAVLGVFIGIFSILATVSIGLALTYNLDSQIENMDGIRVITVRTGGNFGRRNNNNKKEVEPPKLTAKYLQELAQIKGVVEVSPAWEVGGIGVIGKEQVWTRLKAIKPDVLSHLGKNILVGHALSEKDTRGILVPDTVIYQSLELYGTWDEDGNYKEPSLSKQELERFLGKTFEHSFDYNYKSKYKVESEGDDFLKNVKFPVTEFKIVGIIKSGGFDNASYITEKALFALADEMIKQNPTEKDKISQYTGFYEEFRKNKEYQEVLVAASRVNEVKPLIKTLEDRGLSAESPINFFEDIRNMFAMVQMVLGGLGAISLLVAMIGITNTTIMTIYERTKEIGIMKVIGANLTDIRNLFLFESGLIGFVGGVVATFFALIASAIGNYVMKGADVFNMNMGLGGKESTFVVSYIPFWLALSAIILATLIGLLAGYFPSRKAMHMSALDSLRTE